MKPVLRFFTVIPGSMLRVARNDGVHIPILQGE
jgi:hypothetical protein